MNMIIQKKHIVLASLVVGLSIAVYLNWVYSGSDNGLSVTGKLDTAKNYGDAQFVDKQTTDVKDTEAYFAQAKTKRQKSRDEAIDTLKTMLKEAKITDEQKSELTLEAAALAKSIETEGKIENLIKAKGFEDCMVYYDTVKVDVIVKTDGLLSNEVAQMKDIIIKETNVPVENISIVEVK